MSFEMVVGLEVVDQASYARYRAEMRPLLEAAGGSFRYDFEVARTLSGEDEANINRLFVIRFPHESVRNAFFADPRYIEIRKRLFDPSVRRRVMVAEYGVEVPAVR